MRKLFAFLLTTLIYLIVLCLVYWVHVRFFTVDVVFYSAIFDAVLAVLIGFAALYFFRAVFHFSTFERMLIVIIWTLGGYAFAISVPTVIDRSLSFYILEKIDQRGGGIQQQAMEQVFVDEYMKEHQLVAVRLTEQIESGTITVEDGCVLLTPKGQMIARLSRAFRANLLPKQRLLLGQYTDALTDPFRDSTNDVDYACSSRD
jgi:hypothetical protein